ncbi:hypothetical protein VTL71DRAFT_15744 [Oculimacula yallundae]|uniref:Uncharacterized protein n=1 Tax=Oculimacula yallundae TaxID=86028 RepID=A0ABR4CCG8_9HELO
MAGTRYCNQGQRAARRNSAFLFPTYLYAYAQGQWMLFCSSDVEKSFNWLSREARGSAYVSYTDFAHKASCSFDFGNDGYAVSCNEGGKILHMTAKSLEKGILFAQGNFESTLYASLARAQRSYGGQSTFGLEIPVSPEQYNSLQKTGSALRLGEMIERGSFNHRWPFNEYALISNFGLSEDDETESEVESPSIRADSSVGNGQDKPGTVEREVGTCAVLSFVKDGILYQILRLEASTRWEADEVYMFPFFGKAILEVGGPIKFREFEQLPSMRAKENVTDFLPHRPLKDGGISQLDSWNDPLIQLDIRVYRLGLDGNSSSELHMHHTSDRGIGIFKTEADLTYDNWKTRQAGSGRTVTFMASFALRDSGTPPDWTSVPTSEEIYRYIGISSSEPTATAAMWETIFVQRESATGRISELSEDRLVARCLEKILHVDLVPASFGKGDRRQYPSVQLKPDILHTLPCDELEENLTERVNVCLKDGLRSTPLALVSNLFLRPNVDLKALFWKVRFLVKAYAFLLTFAVPRLPDAFDVDQGLTSIPVNQVTNQTSGAYRDPDIDLVSKDATYMQFAAFYQSRMIKNRIELVIEYLFQALLHPNSDASLLPENIFAFEPNYYYAMMTLCYVARKSELLKFSWPPFYSTWSKDQSRLQNRLPGDNDNFNPALKEKVLLLKWYHYGSIRELVARGNIHSSWTEGVPSNHVYRLRRDAVRAAKAKLSSHDVYVAEDEILDRLAFLAWPLGLEDPVYTDRCPATMASITAKRIGARDFTREINPGTVTSAESQATCGPWEIHALSHHSRLMVVNHEYKRRDHRSKSDRLDEVDMYRQRFCDFITAESSVVPCWERKSLATRRGWLRSEATSVVATTLLSICQKDFEILEEEKAPRMSHDTSTYPAQGSQDDFLPKSRDEGSDPAIDWKKYKPPHRYHPEDFFNSLDDTPDFYRSERIEKIEIAPSLRLYLGPLLKVNDYDSSSPGAGGARFASDSIRLAISSTPISIIDLTAHKSEQFDATSRKASHQYRVRTFGAVRLYASETWNLKLEGPVLEDGLVREPPSNQDKQWEQEKVVDRLSDSLVDKGVQHRILAVKSSGNKSLVAHFIYVFHPESANAFSDNIFKISQFSNKNRGAWAANITLRSWSFIRTEWSFPEKPCLAKLTFSGPTLSKIEVSPEDTPIELPLHLHETLRKFQPKIHELEDSKPGQILLNASSIVISTNEFGDFSKCSIISELISEEILLKLKKEVPIVWQCFIHQPQTGRCLVFLLMLGHLCQAITSEHQQAIEYLSSIINIEDYFLRGKQDWLTDQRAIGKLQLALWSLESLYKLRNTLAGSLTTIREAKSVLLTQITKGPGKRSPALESQCRHYIDFFERSLDQVSALYIKVDRKTELGSRYRDSLSTLLSLNDSRSALQQSTTIQKLTYLTIAYLPVGLSAAIFAIPDDQKVVVPAMGRKWFLICILILFIFTAMTAILMGTLLSILNKLRRNFRKRWDFGSNYLIEVKISLRSLLRSSTQSGWKSETNLVPRPESQSKSLEGLNPVESSSRGSLGRVTRRRFHFEDVEAGKSTLKSFEVL